jgi:hypothetical protein
MMSFFLYRKNGLAKQGLNSPKKIVFSLLATCQKSIQKGVPPNHNIAKMPRKTAIDADDVVPIVCVYLCISMMPSSCA